jgi:hypothetical protein
LAAWLGAVFIFRTAPDPQVRVRFAALLFLEGVLVLTSSAGPLLWVGSEPIVRAGYTLHSVNDWLVLAVYLPAVATAIDSPLLRPFRRGPALALPVLVGLGGALAVLIRPEAFLVDLLASTPRRFGSPFFAVVGGAQQVGWFLLTVSYTYGLLATLVAWRDANTALSRRRSGALSLAFGARDLAFGGVFLYGALIFDGTPSSFFIAVQLAVWALLVYVAMTAYGIAVYHLFDIELRLKWTLERGTLAAAFIAVFFVVSEGAATILSDRLGTLAGLLATGLLVFALAPLQRSAERLADAALPAVQDTPEYRAYRRLQIYGEALTDARASGSVTPAGRLALEKLRESLGLDKEAAAELESELESVDGARSNKDLLLSG